MKEGDIHLEKWVNFYTGAFEILWEESNSFFHLLLTKNRNFSPELSTPILLFRKAVECIYGNLSLIKNKEYMLIKSFNRELLESMLYIAYCSEGNTKDRMLSYSIFNLIEKKESLYISSPHSQKYKQFIAKVQKSKVSEIDFPTLPAEEIKIRTDVIDLELRNEPYLSVFDKYYRGNKIKKWYQIDNGSPYLDQLADKLGYGPFYELIYRKYSQYSHSSSLHKKDILFGIDQHRTGELTAVPAPPFELVEDFRYCELFARVIINRISAIFNIFTLKEVFQIRDSVNQYFIDNNVNPTGSFFSPDFRQITHFPNTINKDLS